MIQGSIILFIGILIGYSIRFWKRPSMNKVDRKIQKYLGNQAKIVDLIDPLDKIDLNG